MGMNPTFSLPIDGWLLVARQLSVHAPVRLLDVLEDDVHLIGGGLADRDHRLGHGGGDLALLLIGAAGVPLHGDVGHGGSFLPEALHVLGKVRGERVGLDGAVGAEANGEILGHFGAGGAPAEKPAPRRVAAVEAHLIGLAERALERHLVRPAYGDGTRLGRRELAAERHREAPGRKGDDGKESHHAWRAHASIITRGVRTGQRRQVKRAHLPRIWTLLSRLAWTDRGSVVTRYAC